MTNHFTFLKDMTQIGTSEIIDVSGYDGGMTLKFVCNGTFSARILADIHPFDSMKLWSCFQHPKCTDEINMIDDGYNRRITSL